MKCKFCQAEMPEDAPFCPYCGKDNREDLAEAVEEAVELEGQATVVVADQEPQEEAVSEVEEVIESPQVKRMKGFAILSGCLAVLALLGTVLFFGIRGSGEGKNDGWDVASWFAWMKPRQDTLLGNDSYTVSDRKAAQKRQEVVATMEGAQLTNGQLQIYYWIQVIEFIEEYGYYLSYVGMDYTKPLDEQQSMEEGMTWQQYFLESALDMWRSNQALALMAKENNFKLDEEYQEYLDGLEKTMDETAQKQGFADANAMLQEEMGAGCTMEDYMSYMNIYYNGYMYFGELYDALDPTEAEIEQFFTDNEKTFADQNITKDSGKYYTIRHIQINVEGGTKDSEGNTIYTDDEWAACKAEAQKVMDQWLTGEKTQDSFIALVKDNTDDSNTKENGGKYSGFAKGDMTKVYGDKMEAWCTADTRKGGDCELVQSSKGYHLVFFVESEDIWYAEAEAGLLSELGSKLVADSLEKHPIEVDYTKIVLGNVDLAA